jgi:hypothetical protein
MTECKCKYHQRYRDVERKTVRDEICEGILIDINTDYQEFDTGPGNYPVAVIITSTGTIVTPHVSDVFDIQHPMLGGNNL